MKRAEKRKHVKIILIISTLILLCFILFVSVIINNFDGSEQKKLTIEQNKINNEISLPDFGLTGNYVKEINDDYSDNTYSGGGGGGGSSSKKNSKKDDNSDVVNNESNLTDNSSGSINNETFLNDSNNETNLTNESLETDSNDSISKSSH